MNATPNTIASLEKGLRLLRVLERNFAHGYTPGELGEQAKMSPSDITRYVNTLICNGYAEKIPETGRIRLSHRFGQVAVTILNSLESAQTRFEESKVRLMKGAPE